MFLFTFTKLRKQLFAALLAVFIGIPLLYLFLIFLRIPIFSSVLFSLFFGAGFIGISYYFLFPAAIIWAIFGYGQFFTGGIGVGPNGVGGVIITVIFYLIVVFLLSLVGNVKKDAEYVPWKTALSKQYLKKLFLVIAGVFVVVLLLSGLERLLLFPKQMKDVQEQMKDEQIPVRIESIIQQGVENLPVQMLQFQKEPVSITEEEYDRILSSYKVEFTEGVTASVGPAALLLSSFWKQLNKQYPPSVWVKLAMLPIPNIDLDDLFVQMRVDKVIDVNGKDIKDITFGDEKKLVAGANALKPFETPAPHFAGHKIVNLTAGTKNKNEIARIEGIITINLPVGLNHGTTLVYNGRGVTDQIPVLDNNGIEILTDFTHTSFIIKYNGVDSRLLFPIAYADNGEHIRLYRTATTAASEKNPWGELRYSYTGKIKTLKVFVASRIIERSYPFVLGKNIIDSTEAPSSDKKSCDELEKDIRKEMEDANYCATDSDCAITQFGVCPFGCYNLINKNVDINTIKSTLGIYTSRCPACLSQCMIPPPTEKILCRSNKCVDARNDINSTPQSNTASNSDKQLETIHIKSVLHPVRKSGVLSTKRTDEEVRLLFKETQKIWSQAGIVFDTTISEITIDAGGTPVMSMGNYPFFSKTVNQANDGSLHVYYVRDMAGANGWIVGARHVAVADITTVDDFRATAHEIGHVFVLGHTDDNMESLMASGRNGQKLSESEIARARETAVKLASVLGANNFPTDKQSCETQGGVWGTFGLLVKEQCDMPTSDEGKACADNTQCESVCVADDSVRKGKSATGKCYGRTVTLGTCLNYVKDGKAQGALCED